MGLAGRKQKQRIGHDPRNLSWADDASRFGQNYLSKFGWDASKGLGVQGEGRTSTIKVSQKLDMMGIGAAHSKDPNGIAWKQNKDYENLLARLNAAAAGEDYTAPTGVVAEGGFVRPTEGGEEKEEKAGDEEAKEGKKEKKRKRKEQEGVDSEKKSKKRKKDKGGDAKEDSEATPAPAAEESSDDEPLPAPAPRPVLRRAHRSRHIAAKSMASKSAAAISEILGVAPTPTSLSSSASPMGALTPISDEPASLEKLTKSAKSVTDYFKERLAAKAAAKSGSSTPVPPTVEDGAPRSGLGDARVDDEDEAPRGGLGATRRRDEDEDAPRGGLGSLGGLGLGAGPRADDDDVPRGGLGSFARMFKMPSAAPSTETGKGMAMFAALSSAKVLSGEATPPNVDSAPPTEKEKRKKEKKEKKRKTDETQENEVAVESIATEKKDKKGKKEKRKRSEEDVDASAAVTSGDFSQKEKEKKNRKESNDQQIDADEPVSTPLTKEERKAEKRRRKEEKKRKEA
ncbi:hypothetical protein HDZ31DRAFT_81414 [Schizophyllum fasciatum]